MKSEKAKEYIERVKRPLVGCESIFIQEAETAIEIAEQEMLEKAIEGYRLQCTKLAQYNFCRNNKYYEKMKKCDGNCDYVKRFKEYMK